MRFPLTLPVERGFDVIGFGTNAVDFLIEVPEFPQFNTKIELTDYIRLAGGEVATTMVGLTRLGLRTAYVGRFGLDDAGDFGIQSLVDEGVDTSFCNRIENASTQIAFILIDERSGERTVIWKRDPKLGFAVDEAPLDLVEQTSILHLSPHDVGAATAMAEAANRFGTIVSIDIDRVFVGVEKLLSLVDVLIASSEFPKMLLGNDEPMSVLPEISSRFGCSVVGITRGSRGSVLYCGNQFIETDGFEVPGGCRDTTGAGDAFRVGIIYGLLHGRSVEESAVMANAVAALKCRTLGARTALPREPELREFLKLTLPNK